MTEIDVWVIEIEEDVLGDAQSEVVTALTGCGAESSMSHDRGKIRRTP